MFWKSLGFMMLNGLTGAAIGAFIALLIALSHSPVVASALSVLLAATVLFLALNDKLPFTNSSDMSPDILARLLGFSLAAVIALLIGLDMRASNRFGESMLVADYNDLKEIGLSEEAARSAVLKSFTSRTGELGSEAERLIGTTSLFSEAANPASCREMRPTNFGSLDSLRAKYNVKGGLWRESLAIFDRSVTKKGQNLEFESFFLGVYTGLCTKVKK